MMKVLMEKEAEDFLEKKGFNVKVIKITNAKDPDEAVRSDPFSFKKDIKESIGIYDYFLQRSLTLYNKNTIEGKKNISDFLLPVIERIENEIVKEHYLKKLSLELDTTYDSLLKQVEKIDLCPLCKTKITKEHIIHVFSDCDEKIEYNTNILTKSKTKDAPQVCLSDV